MSLEVQQKLNENEEKLRLEKEKEAVLMKERERGERNFANKNRPGHRVYKTMYSSVRKYSKGCK